MNCWRNIRKYKEAFLIFFFILTIFFKFQRFNCNRWNNSIFFFFFLKKSTYSALKLWSSNWQCFSQTFNQDNVPPPKLLKHCKEKCYRYLHFYKGRLTNWRGILHKYENALQPQETQHVDRSPISLAQETQHVRQPFSPSL